MVMFLRRGMEMWMVIVNCTMNVVDYKDSLKLF